VRHRISTGASATAILEAASREIAAGRDPLDLDLHPERLAAVTAEDLALALEECVGHEAITVIGPSGELLELLEVHQPVEVDWRTESQALFRDYGPPPHQL